MKRLVVVLTSVESKEVLERWEFKVEYETEDEAGDADKKATKQVIREVKQAFFGWFLLSPKTQFFQNAKTYFKNAKTQFEISQCLIGRLKF